MSELRVLELVPVGIMRSINPRSKEEDADLYVVMKCEVKIGDKFKFVLVQYLWNDTTDVKKFLKDWGPQILYPLALRSGAILTTQAFSEVVSLLNIVAKYSAELLEVFLKDDAMNFSEREQLHEGIIYYSLAYKLNMENLHAAVKKSSEINISDRVKWNGLDTGTDAVFISFNEINIPKGYFF